MREMLKFGVRLDKRNFMGLLIPFLTISGWYYIFSFYVLLVYLVQFGSWVFLLFNLCVVSSFLVGCFIDKFSGLFSIYVWALVSPVITIPLIFLSNPFLIGALVFVAGSLYGICTLSFFKYFGEQTEILERGRIGGFIGFIFLIFLPFLLISGSLGLVNSVIVCVILNVSALLLKTLNPERRAKPKTILRKHSNSKRTFLLYIFPWLIFSVVNGMLGKIVAFWVMNLFPMVFLQMSIFQYFMSAVGALIGGIVVDWIGRKTGLITGLTLYGISTALSGIALLTNSYFLAFVSFIISGVSWGIFLVLYFFVVGQDLADSGNGRYYSGIIIFYLSLSFGYAMPQITVSPEIIAFLSSVLIFLSNIFVVPAEELLPSHVVYERGITYYLYRLKKLFKIKGKAD